MSRITMHVLIVEDDETASELVAMSLQSLGHRAELITSGAAALTRLAREPQPDVVLLDVMMPQISGIETLRRYRADGGTVPIVMLSARDEPQTIVQAMRLGANDYVIKPIQHDDLMETLERVVELKPLRACTSTQVIQPGSGPVPSRSLGQSAAMRRVEALCDRVADADVPILITGESGVGKDVVARELHARSSRRDRVFVKINCAALPENLLESELFGYERGAFTGAQRAKPGQFELADGGTLFLDEIGEMPATLQAKLLQALQDGEFYRIGGQKKVRVDVRVIVATNVNLEQAIRDGRFREDLYYRLNVVQMRIPPLRERREDIPALLGIFVERYGKRYGRTPADVPHDVVARFMTYDFPGNVRELENLVRRLMVLRDPSYVYAEMGAAPGSATDMALPMEALVPAEPPAPEILPPLPTSIPAQAVAQAGGGGDIIAMPISMSMNTVRPPTNPPVSMPFAPPLQNTGNVVGFPPQDRTPFEDELRTPAPQVIRGGTYPFGGYASEAAGRPLGELVAEEFASCGDTGRVDLKALGRRAADIAEREAIVAMLARTSGSKREAADRLGISYKAILYKIREFGIGKARLPRKPLVAKSEAAPLEDLEDVGDVELDDEEFNDDAR